MTANTEEPSIAALTTTIVTAYVGHHEIAITDLGRLITDVGHELGSLGREPEPAPVKPEPAVPVGRSVRPDHLLCLVCGKPFKALRRHLQTAHDLTPGAYRELFDLAPDYPIVAAAWSAQRAEIARRIGLGQRRPAEPAPVTEPKPSRLLGVKPVRGRRAAPKAEPTSP